MDAASITVSKNRMLLRLDCISLKENFVKYFFGQGKRRFRGASMVVVFPADGCFTKWGGELYCLMKGAYGLGMVSMVLWLGFSCGQQDGASQVPPAPVEVISRPRAAPPINVAGNSSARLAPNEVALGLKQALTNGVEAAIRELGHKDGFLTNVHFKIAMPKQLRTVEDALRALKQQQLADEFVATMNHAAEKAVPEAAGVFAESISQMTFADAQAILTGAPDAATKFFRRTTETNLYQRFLPIVKKATDSTGVTSNYKKVLSAVEKNKYLGEALDALSNPKSLDLDSYVTNKALDGLFKRIAEEEKRIREDPVARTTDLLRNVFGAISK
jgi:hypothetical protein